MEMERVVSVKKCRVCRVEQPIEEFYLRTDAADGHENTCKPCRRARQAHTTAKKANGSFSTPLLEAARLVIEERAFAYGDPIAHFERAATLAAGMTGMSITPSEVVRVLMAVKLAREQHRHSSEHLVDLAGYAAILDRMETGDGCGENG